MTYIAVRCRMGNSMLLITIKLLNYMDNMEGIGKVLVWVQPAANRNVVAGPVCLFAHIPQNGVCSEACCA